MRGIKTKRREDYEKMELVCKSLWFCVKFWVCCMSNCRDGAGLQCGTRDLAKLPVIMERFFK
jgi:hypothetical protein